MGFVVESSDHRGRRAVPTRITGRGSPMAWTAVFSSESVAGESPRVPWNVTVRAAARAGRGWPLASLKPPPPPVHRCRKAEKGADVPTSAANSGVVEATVSISVAETLAVLPAPQSNSTRVLRGTLKVKGPAAKEMALG